MPVLLLTGMVHSQAINSVKLDSLLKNGQNFTALREINALDTLVLKKPDLALFYFYKAKCLAAENKNAKAFLSYLQAKRAFLAIDSLDRAMAVNLDIAFFLSTEKNNRKKAENYIKDYLSYALEKNENLLIARAYSNWASLSMEEQPSESLKLFKKSIYFSEKAQDFSQLENVYSNVAVLYNEMLQKPDSAIYYIDKSISFAKKRDNKDGICVNLINKASCYYYQKDYQKAVQLLEEANSIELSQNSKNIKSFIYEFLAINYNELKLYKKAYESLSKSGEIKSEFNFAEQNTKISEFNIKYETQEKEIENLTLKAKIHQNQLITYASLGLLLIAIILTVLIYKNLSKKKKIAEQAQLIQTQRLEKTLKDQELHDIDVMLESQEHERQQIANELHDNLGSLLATLKLNFQNLSRTQNPSDKILFDKTDALLEETYQKVRNISHLKNLGIVGSDGLVIAVKKMAEKMTVINRLIINVIPFGLTQRLTNSTEITLFRIIQELCTNIIKHSQADEVNIYLTQHNSDLINVIIEDNGIGFDYKKVGKTDGIGLKNIEKKVEQMGGTFTVDSILSKGTTIIIDLPL
ncbi:ATP-binding protein [Flavobacterium sp. SM2513]|uniref:tetratricopeptide repeat-containing sensor histidine kinase n=1 Tax=Flavobacterium sp. SM2513 TaxID=3424766 RepID=UPI003D7FDC8D